MDLLTLSLVGITAIGIKQIADDIKDYIHYSNTADDDVGTELKETEIVLGSNKNRSNHITLDFKQFPSLSITGITNSGKSKMTEYILKNTKMTKVLINAYDDDFSGVYIKKRITDYTEIEKYLDYLLDIKKFDEPLLLVIDETLSLITNKNIAKKLQILLTKNRHKNLYIICLFQELNKYNCSFKSLFASRVAMRSIQNSDIISSLGTSLEQYPKLKNRDFILLSDDIYFGRTYDI